MAQVRKYGDAHEPIILEEDPDYIDDPVLAFFLDYWHSKRCERGLPLSSDFVPSEVRSYLRWIIVVDALPEYADFRYRVIGTSVCDYFLADGTGKTVTEAWQGADEMAHSIARLYRRTCRLEKPLRHVAPAGLVGDTYFPAFDSIYLPYATDGYKADRVVGAFVFNHIAMSTRRAVLSHVTA